MNLKYNVDQIIVREGHIFGYGWGFVPGAIIQSLSLRLEFDNGIVQHIDAQYGLQRDDLIATFANVSEAQNAGFLFIGTTQERRRMRATLRWTLKAGREFETVLNMQSIPSIQTFSTRVNHYKVLVRKALAKLSGEGVRPLFSKVIRHLRSQPRRMSMDDVKQLKEKIQKQSLYIMALRQIEWVGG